MECTIRVAKTKALISFAVTAKLICVFVFAYAIVRFSHNEAHKTFFRLQLEYAAPIWHPYHKTQSTSGEGAEEPAGDGEIQVALAIYAG